MDWLLITSINYMTGHDSRTNITTDFLKEVKSNILACEISNGFVVRCFGITKDPKTNNFIMVMELKNGNLRQHLNNNFISLSWDRKLQNLLGTISGLKDIHNEGLIHHDFDYPLKRPDADELFRLISKLSYHAVDKDSVIYKQIKEADEINNKSSFSTVQSSSSSTSILSYMTHPQAVYTSKLLDFKNLPEPKNADNDDLEYSDSLRMDFTKLDINYKDGRN
ncbi:kinase-like domain-containing protein [Rhizophagus irregularis DAOM 181602=DAOM 197198]|nr:kinase-like domain-containing protein [Rhizophagus irregularis DAOM 181602=DAOM 197198]